MFSNYRQILKKISETDEENEHAKFTDLIEDIREMKDQDGVSEQVKILLDPICDIIESEEEPEYVQKILDAMIRIDLLIEEKKTTSNKIPPSQITVEDLPPKKESIQFIGKPETIPKKEARKKNKHATYAFDPEDIAKKEGNISIYNQVLNQLYDRLPERFKTKDIEEILFDIFEKNDREIARSSIRVYANKYKKYLVEHHLIKDVSDGTPSHKWRKFIKTDPEEEKEHREKQIEDYIIDWGKEHENTIRPIGVVTQAKLQQDIELTFDEVDQAIKRLVEKNKIVKRTVERENGMKQIYFELK